jgi:hypothetical protein
MSLFKRKRQDQITITLPEGYEAKTPRLIGFSFVVIELKKKDAKTH